MASIVHITPLFLLFITIISFDLNSACIPGERKALLQFKNGLNDDSNRLQSWAANTDCCKWYGIVCSNLTGHVFELHLRNISSTFRGEINSSLLDLKDLRYLDLSNNYFGANPIPSFLGSLKSLKFLNFSQSSFRGMIPHELGKLSNLQYLNLESTDTYADSLDWVSGLSMLEFLDLSHVNLSLSLDWLENVNKLPSLVELHLSSCHLLQIPPLVNLNFSSLLILDLQRNWFRGPIPNQLQQLSSVKELDLSANFFNSSIPDWLYNFRHLEILNLRLNLLGGKISNAIQNLTSLTDLDLSSNLEFEGGIPKSLKNNLCNLRSLSFSRTKLGQEIDEILDILSGCSSNVLESLDLHDCQLSGELSDQLGNFKNLIYLSLSNNFISGQIPTLVSAEMMRLRILSLDNNKLGGSIPSWLGGLSELENINISNNLLQGKVSEMHFANLTKLRKFDGSMNQLSLEVGFDWIPPFRSLRVLRLRSWDIGAQFPAWLHLLKHLYHLDLSNSRISSTIPNWFWNSSQFLHLNLSHNQIRGAIPDIPNIALPLSEIDLSSNQFEGSLPFISTDVRVFDVSKNSFSGSISNFLCYKMDEEKGTQILNLDNNLLTGEISDCWSSWTSLNLIRLSSNNLSGNIPESIGTLSQLMYLHLRDNSLSGELPLSLGNCELLITLDLGENKLTGQIPTWLGVRFAYYMSILSLRGNNFHGHIPEEICHLGSLQILDLAHNNLTGIIPSCIKNFKFMATTDSQVPEFFYYIGDGHIQWDESILLLKGKIVEYDKILKYVKIMDLSSNHLSGEIPEEITQLIALQSLNLSNNILSGKVPENIGVMRNLEALDVSWNDLNGRIPESMTGLTFLSMLNLSYNNLSGKIPLGTQLQSFPSSSFVGNEGLWGAPLTENSTAPNGENGKENEKEKEGDDEEEDEVDWGLYVSLAAGFIVGFWSILCSLVLNRRWRHGYYLFLSRLWSKIWLCLR
ncbi:receptor-like protein EIX2 [Euphorbia lathyris]|uniref:receptor-like protein EIX2 n=1 Tax=Euphorbia lathyris TaxID=212925 RepID=UPI0033130C8A